jgi:hypothetical protein
MNFAQDIDYNDEALEAVQRLVLVAQGAGLNLPTLALAWVLRRGERHRQSPERHAPSGCSCSSASRARPSGWASRRSVTRSPGDPAPQSQP